jgi:hypothetical protein
VEAFSLDMVSPALAELEASRGMADQILGKVSKMYASTLSRIIDSLDNSQGIKGLAPIKAKLNAKVRQALSDKVPKWLKWPWWCGILITMCMAPPGTLACQQAVEYQPLFDGKNPPDMKDLWYEVLSALRGSKDHEGNDHAQQALQAGAPLWEAGTEAMKKCYEGAYVHAWSAGDGSTAGVDQPPRAHTSTASTTHAE